MTNPTATARWNTYTAAVLEGCDDVDKDVVRVHLDFLGESTNSREELYFLDDPDGARCDLVLDAHRRASLRVGELLPSGAEQAARRERYAAEWRAA